jgi:hypothetical protein
MGAPPIWLFPDRPIRAAHCDDRCCDAKQRRLALVRARNTTATPTVMSMPRAKPTIPAARRSLAMAFGVGAHACTI